MYSRTTSLRRRAVELDSLDPSRRSEVHRCPAQKERRGRRGTGVRQAVVASVEEGGPRASLETEATAEMGPLLAAAEVREARRTPEALQTVA